MKKRLSVILIVLLSGLVGTESSSLKQLSETFTKVVKQVNPAVVTITSAKIVKREGRFRHPFEEFFGDDFFRRYFDFPERSEVLGSGVIVDVSDGYILTNNHVVEGADEISIMLMDEREFKAEVVGTDPLSDLAVLKINADGLLAANLGDSDKLEVGEWVLAIGSPFSNNLSHTVTAGIVSAKGRSRVIGGAAYQDFIQTDAAINPGNSGGALINLNGELVGINTAIATGGFTRGNVGVGFAIPINLAKSVMADLISQGRVIRAFLGVKIQDIDDQLARAWNLSDREGAAVSEVVSDTPAEDAGIKVGDVIVEFNGKKVRDVAHLRNLVSTSQPGTSATVKVIRKKREKTFRVELAEFQQEQTVLATRQKVSPKLGLEVEDISSSLTRQFRLEKNVSGVIVTKVSPNSAVAKAGIRPGDVILQVGDNEITSVREFRRAMREEEKRDIILFLVLRQDGSLFIPIENR